MKQRIQKHWWKIALLVVALIIAGVWWNGKQATTTKIVTVTPTTRDITQVLKVSGKIDAEQKARMSFAAASKLTWLNVKEGDYVKKWQGLASVDSRTLQNQMQIAQNTHGKTFRTFENTLDSMNYYSDKGLTETQRRAAESAQLDIASSALTVESADIAVKLAYMSSPISGIVTSISQKNVGALMLPSDVIEIVNPSSIFFSAVVDEEDIGKVTASQSAHIQLDAFPNQTFPAAISRVAFTPSQSESGGTGYAIWLTLPIDNSAMRYRLGMNGDADIILNKQENVLSIPIDSLIERDGTTYVEVMRDGKRTKQTVTTGINDDDYVAITDGLTQADAVIVPSK